MLLGLASCLVVILILSFVHIFIFLKSSSSFVNNSSFECGFVSSTKSSNSMTVQFSNMLLIFMVFDIELILMITLFFYTPIFVGIILLFIICGLYWEWMNNQLKWNF